MSPINRQLIVAALAVGIDYVSTFYVPSTALIEDPINTLAVAVPVLFSAHAVLVFLSLFSRTSLKSALTSLGNAILSTLSMTFLLYIVIVLFGAPLTEKLFQTVAFAAYLSIVTIMPAFAALAPAEGKTWTTVFLQHCPRTSAEIYAYTQTVCALSGAWIGAIVLPLDWERDWQVWPISCIISTFLGHAVGVMAGLVWDSIKYIFAKRKSE